MIDTLAEMSWSFRCDGKTMSVGAMTIADSFKPYANKNRSSYHARDGSSSYFIKLHHWRRLKRRLQATFNRSVINKEWRMLAVAADRGLRVPQRIAFGRRQTMGLITHQAMLLEWIADKSQLLSQTQDLAKSKDHERMGAVLALLSEHLKRMREAGLADRDCGLHNLLAPDVLRVAPSLEHTVWIDLEAACEAPPDDPHATAFTVGGALNDWWTACDSSEYWFRQAISRITTCLPEPRGGWPRALRAADAIVRNQVAKMIRYGRLEHFPPPLTRALNASGSS